MSAWMDRYLEIQRKLETGEPLIRSEQLWLAEEMKLWAPDSKREGRPSTAERDFWIAIHYRLLKAEYAGRGASKRAASDVAAKWSLNAADDVERIERKFRPDCEALEARSSTDAINALLQWRIPKSGRGIN